jgi:DNA helicase-2/ATP-dependent DNA helicase PcrA
MTNATPIKLANFISKGYVIAPAGFGKTHLIAESVKYSENKQLILTHTFAGVNSIKGKLAKLGVKGSKFHVDTIASWTLRLCTAYPKTSEWDIENPSSQQWKNLYISCKKLLSKKFIGEVIKSTYGGLYVDEYQDCSEAQHLIICEIAKYIPTRLFGDPLQAIFDFSEKLVDWEKSVYPEFTLIDRLDIPWRWKNAKSDELGDWIRNIRLKLESGEKFSLENTPKSCVTWMNVDLNNYSDKDRLKVFYSHLAKKGSVAAINSGDQQAKYKMHKIAQMLNGRFSSIEEVEGKDLFSFVKAYDAKITGQDKMIEVIIFLKKCFTKIDSILAAGTKRGEVVKIGKTTKFPQITYCANECITDPTIEKLNFLLKEIKKCPSVSIYRRDLFNRLLGVLRIQISEKFPHLLKAANLYQTKFRHQGRPIKFSKIIGTTLLLKGLEYDHAIVIDADKLNAKQLYVAITRGSRTLTIISKSRYLPAI